MPRPAWPRCWPATDDATGVNGSLPNVAFDLKPDFHPELPERGGTTRHGSGTP
jgi:hypothetical protein